MRHIKLSDVTLKQKSSSALTFKEKLELVRLLDNINVDVIELPAIENKRIDGLMVKSMADAVKNSTFCIQAKPERESIDTAWEAVKKARKPRIQISCPVSSVQMEYLYHVKPDQMLQKISETVEYACSICGDVEFAAEDSTRGETAFVCRAVSAAVEAGAKTITLQDSAGNMIPSEYEEFLASGVLEKCLENDITIGLQCSNELAAADLCAMQGILSGAGEIKAASEGRETVSLCNIARIISEKGEKFGISCGISMVKIKRTLAQIERLFTSGKSKNSPFDDGVRDDRKENDFTVHDDISVINKEIRRLGYDLSEEDASKVYETFVRIASRKDSVSSKEIDAIVASSALQVPPTYLIESYVINSGNTISATCHMKLNKTGTILESVSVGDGPVDAAFLAIEQITGHHYELDDFQIQAVTEGREAMGETIVKLRSGGKVYSGRGISTDVVGSSILAYVSALNKISYEEENS